jgi:adenosylcobyric acid synthase
VPGTTPFAAAREARLDVLGDLVETHLDTDQLMALIEGGVPADLPRVATEVRACVS